MIINIDKKTLAVIPFVVSGATIKVKAISGEDLVVLPYSPQAILERSKEAIEFRYILDETLVLFTNYSNDAQADLDYTNLTAMFVAMSTGGGGGGGGDASAANQLLEIAELVAVKVNQTNGTQVITLPTNASVETKQNTQITEAISTNTKLDTANLNLASIKNNTSISATASNQATANNLLNNLDVNLGAKADASAGSDIGTFSLIALFKRLLQGITTLISNQTNNTQITKHVSQLSGYTLLNQTPVNIVGVGNRFHTLIITNTNAGTPRQVKLYNSVASPNVALTTNLLGSWLVPLNTTITITFPSPLTASAGTWFCAVGLTSETDATSPTNPLRLTFIAN